MPASTRRRASPLLFKWDPLSMGLDYQGNPWALSSNKVITGSFDRGGTVGTATSVDANGRIFTPGYKSARWYHSYDTTTGLWLPRGILLEGSRQNEWTKSQELDDAAWTKTRSSISANAIAAPDGTTTADKLVEDATATDSHFLLRAFVAFTTATAQTVSLYARAGERTWLALQTNSPGTSTSWVNLSTGVAGTTAANHTIRITRHRDGWYRIALTLAAHAGTTCNLLVMLATGDTVQTYSGDGASGVYLWGFQQEKDKAFASSYIPTTSAAVTRSADALSFAFNAVPQASTFYFKFVEGTQGTGRVFQLGKADNTAPYIEIQRANTSQYGLYHHNGSTQLGDLGATGGVVGAQIELRAVLNADGSSFFGQSINGAAETVSTPTAANTLAANWSATPVLVLNDTGNNASPGMAAFSKAYVAAGVKTLAQMRAA